MFLLAEILKKTYNYLSNPKLHFNPSILLNIKELKLIKNNKNRDLFDQKDPDSFYHESAFDHVSDLNTRVFERKKNKKMSNIIFSTLNNLEKWYLGESEKNYQEIEDDFKDCYLIIDESDTILIDELENGTILSRDMNSDGFEILETVYDLKEQNQSPDFLLAEINKKWPECDEIDLTDIKFMFEDIEIAKKLKNYEKYRIIKEEKVINTE